MQQPCCTVWRSCHCLVNCPKLCANVCMCSPQSLLCLRYISTLNRRPSGAELPLPIYLPFACSVRYNILFKNSIIWIRIMLARVLAFRILSIVRVSVYKQPHWDRPTTRLPAPAASKRSPRFSTSGFSIYNSFVLRRFFIFLRLAFLTTVFLKRILYSSRYQR